MVVPKATQGRPWQRGSGSLTLWTLRRGRNGGRDRGTQTRKPRHTHARALYSHTACTHMLAHLLTCLHTRFPHTHTLKCTCTCTHMLTHMPMCQPTLTHIHVLACTCARMLTPTHMCSLACMLTPTHMCLHTHAHTHTVHMYWPPHTRARLHTCTVLTHTFSHSTLRRALPSHVCLCTHSHTCTHAPH